MDIFRKNSFRQETSNRKASHVIYDVCTSHYGLVTFLVLYTFVGAGLFQVIENNHKIIHRTTKQVNKTHEVESWIKTLQTSGYIVVLNEEGLKYEIQRKWEVKHLTENEMDYDDQTWSYGESWCFCMTVLTTIGYGNFCPVTLFGKLLTVFYALFGIPLFYITVFDIGICCSKGVNHLCVLFKCCQKTDRKMDSTGGEKYQETIGVTTAVYIALLMTVMYMLIGALIFVALEGWCYLESLYFVFVSLTTIGFGDLYPKRVNLAVLYWAYMVFGLVLMSMNVVLLTKPLINKSIDDKKPQAHIQLMKL